MSGVTLGQLLLLVGALLALHGAWQLATLARNKSYGRGTPQYAAARDARRFAVWSFTAAILLLLIGAFAPFADLAIAGGGR